MAGRNGKPIQLHILDGKKHLTKSEIEFRQQNEIRLGTSELKMPAQVRRDPVAKKKWKELAALYDGIEFVSSSDIGVIAQLCLSYSELDSLLNDLRHIEEMEPFEPEEEVEIADEMEGRLGARQARNMWRKVEYIMSIDGKLELNKAINQKRSLIRSLEDRLFLNPVAKVKNIPKQQKEKPANPLDRAGFGNV